MLNRLRSIARGLIHRERFEDAMADELRFHLDAYADDLMRAGVSREEAARRARVEFGGVERVREECRQSRGLRFFDELRQDLRYATRLMARSPGFTAAAVVSLALGIGANTAIFSLMDAVLLRTLPLKDPHQLYFLAHDPGERVTTSANYPLFERYTRADVFSGVTAYSTFSQGFRVTTTDGTEAVSGQFVSGNYHAVVGVPLILGRGFTAEPDRTPDASLIAVISDSYWSRRFGRSPDVLGKRLGIRGRSVTIVGVTAASFHGLVPGTRVDVTLPVSVRALDEPTFLDMHDGFIGLVIVGRLRTSVTEGQALSAADTLFKQYMSEPENRWAQESSPTAYRAAVLLPAGKGSGGLRRQYSLALRVLMAMVGCVLVIACANVANLLLVRATARRKEVAVRLGVGAGRSRLVKQFLTESLLLAVGGGIVGLLLAFQGTAAILALFDFGPAAVFLDVTPSAPVLVFTMVVSLLTGVAFGLVPALRATRVDLAPALKESGAACDRGGRWTTGRLLVVSQIALCVIVVAGAGLLVRTLHILKTFDAGFRKENVLLFNVDTASAGFPADRRAGFYAELLERLRARPGVVAASYSARSPIDFSSELRRIDVTGFAETGQRHGVSTNVVTPDYFQGFGIGLIRGRAFTSLDGAHAPKVALVSASMAGFYFGDSDPSGRTLLLGGQKEKITVVGVVTDVRHERLRNDAPTRMVYTPLAQSAAPSPRLTAEIVTTDDPRALAASVRDEARALSKDAVVSYVRTMDQQLDAALVQERVLATLSAAFGLLALLLAAVGLYGVMSYTVARRSREIGIRIALGAARSRLLWQVLRETTVLSCIGIAIGLVGALALARVVSTFLFGLTPRDPMTLAGTAAILLVTTIVAGYLPARRAAGVDPMCALRTE